MEGQYSAECPGNPKSIFQNFQPVTRRREGSCYNNKKRKPIWEERYPSLQKTERKRVIRKNIQSSANLHNHPYTVKNYFNHTPKLCKMDWAIQANIIILLSKSYQNNITPKEPVKTTPSTWPRKDSYPVSIKPVQLARNHHIHNHVQLLFKPEHHQSKSLKRSKLEPISKATG